MTGIALIWTVKGDNLETVRTLSTDDMKSLFKQDRGVSSRKLW